VVQWRRCQRSSFSAPWHVGDVFVARLQLAEGARTHQLQGQLAMSIYLTLVSHGATAATRAAAFPQDEPLEDGALSRVAALGQLRRPDRAWSSPALRARQTAAALALDAAVNGSLRECDYGRWAGRTFTDVQTDEPASVAAWLSDAEPAPHGGESLSDLFRRVWAWMDEFIREEARHTIAVTHAAVIRAAILPVLDAPPQSFWRIDIEPLSVIKLRGYGTRWTLVAGEQRVRKACCCGGGIANLSRDRSCL
jgi:broad specificity phosphatase PhoE